MRTRSTSGFTLVELLIVVLIIGILATIAIPVFNGQRNKARNAVAKSALRNAMSAGRTYFTTNGNFDDFTTADLVSIEPTLVVLSDAQAQATTHGSSANPQAIHATTGTAPPDPERYAVYCNASKGDKIYCIWDDTRLGFNRVRYRTNDGTAGEGATVYDVRFSLNDATTGWKTDWE